MRETEEKLKNQFSGETSKVLFSRDFNEIGQKQRQMEEIIENFKLIFLDFNIFGTENQHVDEEITAIEALDIDYIEVPYSLNMVYRIIQIFNCRICFLFCKNA